MHIIIGNNHQEISSTNYFDSEPAKEGLFFLSWNAGAARLLIPDSQYSSLDEFKTAKYVIISRGKHFGRDTVELLFEDFTDSPFVIYIVAEQCDRMLPQDESGCDTILTAWTRAGKQFSLPAKYRVVDTLPDLSEWVDK